MNWPGKVFVSRTVCLIGTKIWGAKLQTVCRRYQLRVEQYTRSQAAADKARPPGEEKAADVVFEGGLHIPGDLYARLFDYQKTGVQVDNSSQ